jgi:hypothetical protein
MVIYAFHPRALDKTFNCSQQANARFQDRAMLDERLDDLA